MAPHICPKCHSVRSWAIRRNSRKCRSCRREWTPSRWVVPGICIEERPWRVFIRCFLRYKTQRSILLHFPHAHTVLLKMSTVLRTVMMQDMPELFSGVVEVDETYIAGTWYNKRWVERKYGTKRGRGSSKQPIFGMLGRTQGAVRIWFVPNVQKRTLMPIITKHITSGSTIYSDGYQLYQETVYEGYHHDYVDHHQNEYARGDVSTNAMEGFWGLLKRRLRSTGGIRRTRLHLYAHEEAWRYNHRRLTERAKTEKLLQLLKEFGGRKVS